MSYYLAQGQELRGPHELSQLIVNGLRPDSLVWREGMAQWQRADTIPELRELLGMGIRDAHAPAGAMTAPPVSAYPPSYSPADPRLQQAASKKVLAGLMGILFGSWGIHRFVLGDVGGGLLRILITALTCGIGGLIGLIEGIIYLTKSDADFYQTYMVERRGWF